MAALGWSLLLIGGGLQELLSGAVAGARAKSPVDIDGVQVPRDITALVRQARHRVTRLRCRRYSSWLRPATGRRAVD